MYYVGREIGLKVPKTRIVEFANSVDPDEVAHDEPPHLDLHCLPASVQKNQKCCRYNFAVLFFST